MSFEPLLRAPSLIQLHALCAILALVLGILQLTMVKGTQRHRVVGYVWVVLMMVLAVSSFFIHRIRTFGPFSPIHILSLLTIITIPRAILAARSGNIVAHRRGMILLFWLALVGAGLFTLLPGRIMGQMVFGS
jgi:uncharacterized membrane protein